MFPTPLASAQIVERVMEGNGVLLTREGYGHCSTSMVSKCAMGYVKQYFETGQLPAKGRFVGLIYHAPPAIDTTPTPATATLSRKRPSSAITPSDEATSRGKRMFGALMGSLMRQQTLHTKTDAEKRRKETEKRLREKLAAEQKKLHEEVENEKEAARKTRESRAARILAEREQEKKSIAATQARNLANFLKTSTEPAIFFLPAKHNPRTKAILEAQQKAAEETLALAAATTEADAVVVVAESEASTKDANSADVAMAEQSVPKVEEETVGEDAKDSEMHEADVVAAARESSDSDVTKKKVPERRGSVKEQIAAKLQNLTGAGSDKVTDTDKEAGSDMVAVSDKVADSDKVGEETSKVSDSESCVKEPAVEDKNDKEVTSESKEKDMGDVWGETDWE
ncbi:hypothetical protein HDU98_006754 [Podochytrium sp. JEL0797]|nr:hypothetical protein HDU98_006754 [Podochytrium sp. JEL0797]